MTDLENPTNQFHTYSAPTAVPQRETMKTGGFSALLDKLGLGTAVGTLRGMEPNETVSRARDYARANPSKVLGGLAALVIGAGLMRNRSKR